MGNYIKGLYCTLGKEVKALIAILTFLTLSLGTYQAMEATSTRWWVWKTEFDVAWSRIDDNELYRLSNQLERLKEIYKVAAPEYKSTIQRQIDEKKRKIDTILERLKAREKK